MSVIYLEPTINLLISSSEKEKSRRTFKSRTSKRNRIRN